MSAAPPVDPAAVWNIAYSPTPYDLWTRTNVGEVFPEAVTPLTFSIMVLQSDAIFLNAPDRLRLIPRQLIKDGVPPAVFRAINGRMFYNTGLVYHLFTDVFGLPSWLWMVNLGGPQEAAATGLPPRPLRPRRLIRALRAVLAENSRQRRVIAAYHRDREAMHRRALALRREVVTALTLPALDQRITRLLALSLPPQEQLFDGSAAAISAFGMLTGLCQRWCDDRALANDLVTGLDAYDTAHATVALWAVARAARGTAAADVIRTSSPAELTARLAATDGAGAAAAALDTFLEDFGHRASDEFELASPRWSDDLSFISATLRTYLEAGPEADPAAHLVRQQRRRRAAEREAQRRMRAGLLHTLLPYRRLVFRLVLRQARSLLPLRENPKHLFLMYQAELRRSLLEIGGRLAAAGILADAADLFFLTREEMTAAIEQAERGGATPGLPALIAGRRELLERFRAWQPAEAIPDSAIAALEQEVRTAPAAVAEPALPATGPGELLGIAASAGVVTGRARVALNPDDGAEIEPGEVLVAPFTDPGWTPLFTVAGAIVMDLGGLLSHGAIVAREYGIPAVVNTRAATRRIRTGQLVTVDGDRGTVRWQDDGAGG